MPTSSCILRPADLLRTALAEARRIGSRLRLAGPEVDDLGHQTAADALLTITGKVETSRRAAARNRTMIGGYRAGCWKPPTVPMGADCSEPGGDRPAVLDGAAAVLGESG